MDGTQPQEQKKIFYISDWATDDVYAYSYPRATLIGKLTGFQKPYGQCADKVGDEWIADFDSFVDRRIRSRRHDSNRDANYRTEIRWGAQSRPSGDLAVANFATPQAERVTFKSFFKGASGEPTDYSNSIASNLWAPGYDKNSVTFTSRAKTRNRPSASFALAGGR